MYSSSQSQNSDGTPSQGGALPSKTPVSLLQELCMRRGISPKYDLLQIEGPVHEPTFVYRVTVGEFAANGSGQTKKKAKHAAAKAVLDIIIQGGAGSQGGQSDSSSELTSQIVSPYDDGIPGNPVGSLQELCMSRRWPPPTYELTAEEGFPHERTFSICCAIGSHKEIGNGKSKKLAKRQAANKMILKLKDQPVEQPSMSVLADDDDEVKLHSYSESDISQSVLTPACTEGEKICVPPDIFSIKKSIGRFTHFQETFCESVNHTSSSANANGISACDLSEPCTSNFISSCSHCSSESVNVYKVCHRCFVHCRMKNIYHQKNLPNTHLFREQFLLKEDITTNEKSGSNNCDNTSEISINSSLDSSFGSDYVESYDYDLLNKQFNKVYPVIKNGCLDKVKKNY